MLDHGARAMLERQEDVFYYLTVMNENYAQPSLPAGAEEGIVKGMYRFAANEVKGAVGRVRLLGSGAILREALAAGELLAGDWRVASEVFSVTSYGELARETRETERGNRLHPERKESPSHLERCLAGKEPMIAASDYVCAYPQMIAPYVEGCFVALGTDGFGRSDTRAALRRYFEVDRHQIVVAALHTLSREGDGISPAVVADAIRRYGIDPEAPPPWSR